MKHKLTGHYFANTDIGKVRINNEDQSGVFVNSFGEILLVVCDGMGGHNAGDYASNLAVKLIKEAFFAKSKPVLTFLTKSWIARTIRFINSQIYNEAYGTEAYQNMGTTLVAVLLSRGKKFIINIGDSRAYSYDEDGVFTQITEDETYVDYLYRSGQISKEEEGSHPQRHVLMNALGIFVSPSFELVVKPYNNEKILLCSDGLYNMVSEKEIVSILSTNDSTKEKVQMLINQANVNGGNDNIAVALWEIFNVENW